MQETLRNITAENVGFNLAQEAAIVANSIRDNPAILETVARDIMTYKAEYLEDRVVSYYPYYRNFHNGENRLFRLDSNREEDLAIGTVDWQERNGAVFEGFAALEKDIGKIDTGWFLWISPRGKAGTQGIYQHITYQEHQIYIGSVEKGKVDAYALQSDVDESLLSEWVHIVSKGSKSPDPKCAESFVASPVVMQCLNGEREIATSLLTLRAILAASEKEEFYKNISVDEVFSLMKIQRVKQEEEVKQLQNRLSCELSTPQMVNESYVGEVLGNHMVALLRQFQDERGNVQLNGCVGGSISINQLFGSSLASSDGIFSSAFRVVSTGAIVIADALSEACNKISCKKCNWEASEEEAAKIQEGKLTSCPKCGWKP